MLALAMIDQDLVLCVSDILVEPRHVLSILTVTALRIALSAIDKMPCADL